jgi:hypothetical protein
MTDKIVHCIDTCGKFILTKTRIEQRNGRDLWRWVTYADLRKALPKNGASNPPDYSLPDPHWPKILHVAGDHRPWLTNAAVRSDGRLSIGCKRFGAAATRAIYKAAGIRRKVMGR